MASSTSKTLICLLVILASALVLFGSLRGFGPSIDTSSHQVLGKLLAQEAVKALAGAGRVSIIGRDTSAFKNPYADAELKSLRRALKKGGISVSSVRLLTLNPLRFVTVPSSELFDLMKK